MKKFLSALLVISMMAILLTGTVSAADPKQAFVSFNCIDYNKNDVLRVQVLINEGDAPVYLLTNEDGLAYKNGASASNYNIKFEYPTGGAATLYLKNANLIGQYDCPIAVGRTANDKTGTTEVHAFDFVLYIEAESTVTAKTKDVDASVCGPSAISLGNKGQTTITGPGKLIVSAESNNCIVNGGGTDLQIKNAKIKSTVLMPYSWGTREPIWCNGGGIIIENSELDLFSTSGPCIWSSEKYSERIGEKYDITLKNSTIKCVSDRHSTEFGVVGAMGKIYVDNCDLEIISTGANGGPIRAFSPKPTLSNVTAIGGKTQEKATEYNDKKNSTTYYFKSTATAGTTTPTTPAETTPVATTPVGGGTTATTPVGGGSTATTPTTPVGGGSTATTPTTPVGGGDVVDPTTDGTVDPTTDAVVDPTTEGTVDPTGDNSAPTTNEGSNNTESKPADETTPKDDDTTEEKGSNAVVYIVIAVVAAAAIAGGVFFFLKKKKAA